MTTFSRAEIEREFQRTTRCSKRKTTGKHWGDTFTPDAVYVEHHEGTFVGRPKILAWLVPVMARCKGWVYPIEWIAIDGNRAIYKWLNRLPGKRADGSYYEFPGLVRLGLRRQRPVVLSRRRLQLGDRRARDQGLHRRQERRRRRRAEREAPRAARRVVASYKASGSSSPAAHRASAPPRRGAWPADGARVAILDIDTEKAESWRASSDGRAWTADVRDLAVDEARDGRRPSTWMGGLDVLVNNAGVGNFQLLDDHKPEIWQKVIDVNLTGAYHGMVAAVPLMKKSGGGAIVNNSSGSGVRPTRGELPYSAAKAGVIALTQGAAQEYGPTIRVNCVSPGLIRTPMSEALFKIPGILDPVLKSTPLERTGTAEEVADAIAFLASDRAKFITGQNLVIDGGMGLAQAGIDETLAEAPRDDEGRGPLSGCAAACGSERRI